MWITNANVADVAIVYAKTDPAAGHRGVTAFVVPTHTPGFEATRVPCRGLGKLMPTNSVSLVDVRVPAANVLGEEGQGFVVAMNAMDYGRLTVAARSVGLAQACLDAALEYADQREAFGEKIGSFQMVKKQLADMTCEVAAARGLVRAAAAKYDTGDLATRESSIAKYFAGEVCNRAAQATAEIFGGAAFSDDLPIGLYLNYAKLWQTGEGSANIQALLIADDALGWRRMDRHRTVLRGREPRLDGRMADVEVEVRGPALWITLNRPERRNAYDADMAAAIVEALVEAPRHHAVVITGYGEGLLRRGSADQPRVSPTWSGCVACTRVRCGCSTRSGPARGRSSPRSTAPPPVAATSWWWPATSRSRGARRRSGRPGRGSGRPR